MNFDIDSAIYQSVDFGKSPHPFDEVLPAVAWEKNSPWLMNPNELWDSTFRTMHFEERGHYENPSAIQLAINLINFVWCAYSSGHSKILRFYLWLWNKAEIASLHWLQMSISSSAVIFAPEGTHFTCATWGRCCQMEPLVEENSRVKRTCFQSPLSMHGRWSLDWAPHKPLNSIKSEE